MTPDRVHPSDAPSVTSHLSGSPGTAPSVPPGSSRPLAVTAELSTPLLRRCTALAARARVDLLSTSRRGDTGELEAVLAAIQRWEPEAVLSPDPTMVALAAAALQDLQQRLPAGSRSTLGAHIPRTLEVLHVLIDSRVGALA